jgi:hypothetical protein
MRIENTFKKIIQMKVTVTDNLTEIHKMKYRNRNSSTEFNMEKMIGNRIRM